MTHHQVRGWLALLIVGVFMALTAFMALYPLLSTNPVPLDEYTNFFFKIVSVYAGIIGVIVGFYFNRLGEREKSAYSESDEIAPNPNAPPDANHASRGRHR